METWVFSVCVCRTLEMRHFLDKRSEMLLTSTIPEPLFPTNSSARSLGCHTPPALPSLGVKKFPGYFVKDLCIFFLFIFSSSPTSFPSQVRTHVLQSAIASERIFLPSWKREKPQQFRQHQLLLVWKKEEREAGGISRFFLLFLLYSKISECSLSCSWVRGKYSLPSPLIFSCEKCWTFQTVTRFEMALLASLLSPC